MSDRQAKLLRKTRRRMHKVLATAVEPIPGIELKLGSFDFGTQLRLSGYRAADEISNAVCMRADRRWRRMDQAPARLRFMLNDFFTRRRPLKVPHE